MLTVCCGILPSDNSFSLIRESCMFFTEKNRKKNLIVFFLALPLFCGAVFLTQTHVVHASYISDGFDLVFKGLLLGIFTMIGWIASVAITLFEWVIKPENVSGAQGLLNQPVVYEMWKFVRDFFNLFFILVLLFIAFKIVFQIEHDFKKTLLSLVLAALYINFSYPVTRVLIDVTNVPMYFFANQMAAGNGSSPGEGGGYTSVFSSAMSASKIKGILIPGAENGGSATILANSYSRYLIAIVFMFLFSVTLLVLAVMFVVRLVALVILVIFSSVGFAASIVPGLSSYADMWWKNFWKYAFFGPAAMLMLLVSVRFFSALGDEKTGIFKNLTIAAAGNVSSDPTFFASMALFSVPIIMLWMAMGLAQEFSIAGASSVVGQGKKFSKWVGANASGYNAGRFVVNKAVPAGAKWVERNVLGKRFSPRAIIAGWNAKTADAEAKFLGPATGYWHNNFNKVFRAEGADYEMLEKSRVVAKRQKEIEETSEESDVLLGMASKVVGKKGTQAQTDLQAIFRTLIHNNDHDELMEWIHENVEKDNDLGKKFKGMGFNEGNSTVGGENTARAVDILLKESGLGERDVLKHLSDLGTIATQKGGIMFGAVSVNSNGEHERNYTDPGKMAELTSLKVLSTPDSQNVPKTMHRNNFTDQHGGLNKTGEALLRNYASPSAIEQIARHKPDFIAKVGGDENLTSKMHQYANDLQKGTAKKWDLKLKKEVTIKDEDQALQASAWTAALQAKAGISQDVIEKEIKAAGFNDADVKAIISKAGGPKKPS